MAAAATNTPPLHQAVLSGSYEVVNKLLDDPKVRIDEKDSRGCTALWLASDKGVDKIVALLLSRHAVADAINHDSESPLYAACRKGHIDTARTLVANNAWIDCPAVSNATPLITAAYHGRVEVVMFLVTAGADIFAHTANGTTAVIAAQQGGHAVIKKYLKFQQQFQREKPEDKQKRLHSQKADKFYEPMVVDSDDEDKQLVVAPPVISEKPAKVIKAEDKKDRVFTTNIDPLTLYTELTKLDAGASGEVYKGKRAQDGGLFAIKKIPFSSHTDLAELEHEIQMMRSVCHSSERVHSNIIRLFDAHLWQSNVWIIMEFMSGGKLTDLIKSRCRLYIDESVIAYFCLEIIKGLKYLHSNRVIHRDIKSDNILVGHDGSVKLGDFGLSAMLDKEGKRKTALGTPFWMAPEVIKGDPYDCSADIWSLGVVAIELVEGDPPYITEKALKAMQNITLNPPPRLKREAQWSDEFRQFLYSMLDKDPGNRPTAEQLLDHPFLSKVCPQTKIISIINKLKSKPQGQSGFTV